MQKLRIIDNGKLTYSGLLLFGKNSDIQSVFTDFRIDLIEIPGTSYSDAKLRYTYRLDEQENIWEYYFTLFDRLRLRIGVPFKLGSEGFAIEESAPLEAIREALVNLLMHTDYFSPAKPRIRIFDNRIEFFNPGSMPMSFEKLMKMDTSIPRNPIIAKVFRAVKLSENAGYGFEKMVSGWKEFNNTVPEFYSDIMSTVISFSLISESEALNDTINDTINERQKHIIKVIINNKNITIDGIAEETQVGVATVKRDLEILKAMNLLKRIGSRKGGHWEIPNFN